VQAPREANQTAVCIKTSTKETEIHQVAPSG